METIIACPMIRYCTAILSCGTFCTLSRIRQTSIGRNNCRGTSCSSGTVSWCIDNYLAFWDRLPKLPLDLPWESLYVRVHCNSNMQLAYTQRLVINSKILEEFVTINGQLNLIYLHLFASFKQYIIIIW